MNRLTLSIFTVCLFTLTGLRAQEDFAELSSKERINLAEKEEAEAARDTKFQDLMQTGHSLFRGKHYLKAIHAYEKAQDRRPYNVYPKVIIADIELSMKDTLKTLRAAEQQKPQVQPEIKKPKTKPDEPQTKSRERNDETEAERLKKLNDWEKQERARMDRERQAKKEKESKPAEVVMDGDVQSLSIEDYQKELAQKYPDGITENVDKQGNKMIITRIVVKNNIGNEYKKVVHDWGGIFYFKNGDAVTERVWKQETEK